MAFTGAHNGRSKAPQWAVLDLSTRQVGLKKGVSQRGQSKMRSVGIEIPGIRNRSRVRRLLVDFPDV